MARTTKPKPPPATTLSCSSATARRPPPAPRCPGGPPACTSPTRAATQADAAAARIAELDEGRRRLRVAARAHPRDRGTDRQGRSACGCSATRACSSATSATGPARELKDLSKLPEWRTVQRYPSGFRFPGGESFTEMQARITVDARPTWPSAPRARPSWPSRTPTRSRRPSPTRWAPTSTSSSASSSRRAR